MVNFVYTLLAAASVLQAAYALPAMQPRVPSTITDLNLLHWDGSAYVSVSKPKSDE
jgi:hypothetical protein